MVAATGTKPGNAVSHNIIIENILRLILVEFNSEEFTTQGIDWIMLYVMSIK